MKTNIFCIVGRCGAGSTEYINTLFDDKKFVSKYELSRLIYSTTRKKKDDEIDGEEYHFETIDQYKSLTSDQIIEFRSYYTTVDETVYYYTKKADVEYKKNIICVASPYQYELYRAWCSTENIREPGKYNIFMIILDTSAKNRYVRSIDRLNTEEEILEFCRRMIQDKAEFNDSKKRIPELMEPSLCENVCYINNDSDKKDTIKKNADKIKLFIQRMLEK